MSVEAVVIAACVEEGSPKKALQAGISASDFQLHEEEFEWLLTQMESKRPINWRRFQQAFDDFDRVIPNERLQDLCDELRREAGYNALVSALDQVADGLSPENIIEQTEFLHEITGDVLRTHSPVNDIILSEHKSYLKRIKDLGLLRENGIPPGIPTGIKTLDAHWGGLQNGRAILVLGRPGDAKSMLQAKFCVSAFKDGRRSGLFSPEMNEDEHRARIATLLSALPEVQEELGLRKAFRNRALMDGTGFNYKTYKRFWEWYEEQPGEIVLFNRANRRQKMSPAYIDSKVGDYGLELVIADPIYKMRSGIKNLRGWEELQAITDMLCDMGEIHGIPVVMSNQAQRQTGNRGDAPHKDNSFNGDAPVQEADHVIGVKNITEETKLILRCTKNRFGQDFRVDCKFVPNIGILEDVSFKDFDYYNGHEDGSDEKMKKHIEELEREMEHDKR
jgi:replicative DNA helicase